MPAYIGQRPPRRLGQPIGPQFGVHRLPQPPDDERGAEPEIVGDRIGAHPGKIASYLSDRQYAVARPGLRTRADRRSYPYGGVRSEEHQSELPSLMRISYAGFCLKQKKTRENTYS